MNPLTQSEINKYITEKVLGRKWHELTGTFERPDCSCGGWFSNEHYRLNPDYSQDEHYGPMIRECMKKEWWGEFVDYHSGTVFQKDILLVPIWLLNPALGSAEIVEFLKGGE